MLTIDRSAYPALYQVADASSLGGQRTYRLLVQIELLLIIAGAALGSVGAFVPAIASLTGSLAAVCLLGAIVMKLYNRQAGGDARWFDGRAVAETVKTQTWRYMMRVSPYEDEATADDLFGTDLLRAIRARPDLRQPLEDLPVDPRQISSQMRHVRATALSDRRDVYVHERLDDQARWYRRRASAHQTSGRRWFFVSLAGQAVAVAIALASVVRPGEPIANLVGVFAAAATAATAWSQLGRHDELEKAYALAYQELITIRALGDRIVTEADLDRLVTTGEGAISREHTMWMAKLGRNIPTAPEAPHA